jgi:hypothetical protein
MRWQYRTIVFEFQKDGLLGDRFIDDEGVEKTLNEQGREGWELVSATMIQDGLLTLLKRPEEEQHQTAGMQISPAVAEEPSPGRAATGEQEEEIDIGRIQEQEREHIRSLQQQRARAVREEQKRLFGEIRIR